MEKQFFIPNPVNNDLLEVTEEMYRSYYRPIWRTRSRAMNKGECRCAKNLIWKCDGVCVCCDFYSPRNMVSIDTPIGDEDSGITIGDTLIDPMPTPESILIKNELENALHDELNRLSPENKYLCKCFLMTRSERQAAELANIPWSTFRSRWVKIKTVLSEKLKDYYF